MGRTIIGLFDSRRDADLAVEHLVQEHKIERSDVFVDTAEDTNSAGIVADGADLESGHPGVAVGRPALAGAIRVSVDCDDDMQADQVSAALAQAGRVAQ